MNLPYFNGVRKKRSPIKQEAVYVPFGGFPEMDVDYDALPKLHEKGKGKTRNQKEQKECRQFHRDLNEYIRVGCTKHLLYFLCIHIANERATTPRYGKILKEMGVKKGTPDYLIVAVSKNMSLSVAFLEVKWIEDYEGTTQLERAKRLTVDQAIFRDSVLQVGIHYSIPCRAHEAIATLFQWGFLREAA